MKKMEVYRALSGMDCDISWIANVILTQHPQAARKLKTLHRLITTGHSVHSADAADALWIDGKHCTYSALDSM